jgi:hypothetical protein
MLGLWPAASYLTATGRAAEIDIKAARPYQPAQQGLSHESP